MRRASWALAAVLVSAAAPAWAASDSGDDRSGEARSSGQGQEIVVDPDTGEVTVRNKDEVKPPGDREKPPTAQNEKERTRGKRTSVAAQAGLITYAGQAARVTEPGAAYGISISRDLIRGVNAEFGYLGSSYRVQGGSGGISENGADLLVKVGPEYGRVSPFALWGLELSRLGVSGESNGVRDATMLRLPMGAGLAYTLPSDNPAEVTLGLRVEYLFTLDSGAFPQLAEPSAANQFLSALSIGGRF